MLTQPTATDQAFAEQIAVAAGWLKASETFHYRNYYEPFLDVAPTTQTVVGDELLEAHLVDAVLDAEENHCYLNCYNAVSIVDDFTYWEGLATLRVGIPIQHAWLVENATGRIVDPTWALIATPGERATYAGLPFASEFVIAHAIQTGRCSFFAADWQNNHKILKRGFLFDEQGRVFGYPEEQA